MSLSSSSRAHSSIFRTVFGYHGNELLSSDQLHLFEERRRLRKAKHGSTSAALGSARTIHFTEELDQHRYLIHDRSPLLKTASHDKVSDNLRGMPQSMKRTLWPGRFLVRTKPITVIRNRQRTAEKLPSRIIPWDLAKVFTPTSSRPSDNQI